MEHLNDTDRVTATWKRATVVGLAALGILAFTGSVQAAPDNVSSKLLMPAVGQLGFDPGGEGSGGLDGNNGAPGGGGGGGTNFSGDGGGGGGVRGGTGGEAGGGGGGGSIHGGGGTTGGDDGGPGGGRNL